MASTKLAALFVVCTCFFILLKHTEAAAGKQVSVSSWKKHYTSEGLDICASDPLNDVCSCPCDSDLITVTTHFSGAKSCIYPDKYLSADNLCVNAGLVPGLASENTCGSVRKCDTKSGKSSCSFPFTDGQKCPDLSSGAVNYADAQAYCAHANMRLCSLTEVLDGAIESDDECNMNQEYVWTSTKCDKVGGCDSDGQNKYYVTYARPSVTIFGNPQCLTKTAASLSLGTQTRKIYPACCANTAPETPTWTLAYDDMTSGLQPGSSSCLSGTQVDSSGWDNAETLAFNAGGTGYRDQKKPSCSSNGVTSLDGASCRSMHGPFFNANGVRKSFDLSSFAHKSIQVGLRVWANDMWTTDNGPVTVEWSNDGSAWNTVWSKKRTIRLECDEGWNEFSNGGGTGDGYIFEPGKPRWSMYGGQVCFNFVKVIFSHTGNTLHLRVGATGLKYNSNPALSGSSSRAVNYEYYAFDLLQIHYSNDPIPSLSLYDWGNTVDELAYADYNGGTLLELEGDGSLKGSWSQSQTMALANPGKGNYRSLYAKCSDFVGSVSCVEIHGPWGKLSPSKVEKTVPIGIVGTDRLPQLRIKIRFWAGDSWDASEMVAIYFDDNETPHWEGEGRPISGNQDPKNQGWTEYELPDRIYQPWGGVDRGIPMYVDKEFIYTTTNPTLKISVASSIDQNRGDEWWGFSHLQVIRSTSGATNNCPGDSCSDSCLKWPGAGLNSALAFDFCRTEEGCAERIGSESTVSACKAETLSDGSNTCVPSPQGSQAGTSKTACLLCDSDFWCARNQAFPAISFVDPTRNDVNDPMKNREVSLIRVTSFGSMGIGGLTDTNRATTRINGAGVERYMYARGVTDRWQCNDCFQSSTAEFEETETSSYTYFDPSQGSGGNNVITVAHPSNYAWCVSRVEVEICARPGKAGIDGIECIDGCNLRNLSPLNSPEIKIIGTNLGPIVELVTYGTNGNGYTISPSDCRTPRQPYTELICKVAPGIGSNLAFKIKTNKVKISDVSTSNISYAVPSKPSLSPISVSTSGGTEVQVSGSNTYLGLLNILNSASATLLVNGKSFSSTLSGSSLIFTAPEMTLKSSAVSGVPVKIQLEVTDPKYGLVGSAISEAGYLMYNPPQTTGLSVSFINTSSTVVLTVDGSNFGASALVGYVTLCRSVGQPNATCTNYDNTNPEINIWTHSRIAMGFSNNAFPFHHFPGNLTVVVGNRKTRTSRFSTATPRIINWEDNLNLVYPTQGNGDGNFTLTVENVYIQANGDQANWHVYITPSDTVTRIQLSFCADPDLCKGGGWLVNDRGQMANGNLFTTIRVMVPPGQGTNVPVTFEHVFGDSSNTVYYGGYLPPAIATVFYGSETVASQATGEYGSENRVGLPSVGANVKVSGYNLGLKAEREWCDIPQTGCTGSPSTCCVGRWKSATTTAFGVGSSHTDVTASVPAGIGLGHLLRIKVGGQVSNAVALRYAAPILSSITNQGLNTSGSSSSETSPGRITLTGQHFGQAFTDTATRYGLPLIKVGSSTCPVDVTTWSDSSISCHIAAGQGKNLTVQITVGEQQNVGKTSHYAYAHPIIDSVTPLYGLTDGTTTMTVTGMNFGTASATILFQFVRQSDGKIFARTVIPSAHTHAILRDIPMPEGQGVRLSLRITVDGQPSADLPLVPGKVNASSLGYPDDITLQGPYLPPLLDAIKPPHGRASGCKTFEDLNKWKNRYLTEGGGGRRCEEFSTVDLSGKSFGISDASVEIKNEVTGIWEAFSSDDETNSSALAPFSHSHSLIVAPSPKGMGKNKQIRLVIGGLTSINTLRYDFDKPRSLKVSPVPFDARGTEEITISAEDGLGEESTDDTLNVTIGGLPCMGATWKPINPEDGRPFITCRPTPDVAGSKDLAIFVSQTWDRTLVNKKFEFNQSVVFSVCKSGTTNITTDITERYFGRPCYRNSSTSYEHSAPCVKSSAGLGELCALCPEGASCYVPGRPWSANTGTQYTYFDPTAKAGFFRIERDTSDPKEMEEIRKRSQVKVDGRMHIDKSRWDPSYKSKHAYLVQREKIFDFVPCVPKDACSGSNECDIKYRFLQEQCKVWEAKNPSSLNCTTNNDCRTRSGGKAAAACSVLHPEDCAVCDKTLASSDGIGRCRCKPPTRCGKCTQPAEYPNGIVVKGHFMLEGECAECPTNVILIIVGAVCAIIGMAAGASYLNAHKVNLAFASIGVDYFQVLAIFRGANIPWPKFLSRFFQFFAFFNLNIDIAAPECLDPNIGYSIKFIFTEIMPLAALVLLILDYLVRALAHKFCRSFLRRDSKRHWRAYISEYLIILNFLYLVVTRRAFQVSIILHI